MKLAETGAIALSAVALFLSYNGDDGSSATIARLSKQLKSQQQLVELLKSEVESARIQSGRLDASIDRLHGRVTDAETVAHETLTMLGMDKQEVLKTAVDEGREGESRLGALEPAPSDLATYGFVRNEPEYVSFTADLPVEVKQDSRGGLVVQNSDPDLAFKTASVRAERADGTIEVLKVTVPPPSVG